MGLGGFRRARPKNKTESTCIPELSEVVVLVGALTTNRHRHTSSAEPGTRKGENKYWAQLRLIGSEGAGPRVRDERVDVAGHVCGPCTKRALVTVEAALHHVIT